MHLLVEPLLRLFAALVSRGGEPRPDRDRFGQANLVYPVRRGTLFLLLGCAVYCLYSLAVNLPLLLHNGLLAVHPFQLGFGLFCGTTSFLLLSRTLSLGEDGLRLSSVFGAGKRIGWEEMHHVERYHSRSADRDTWFFRSAPDPRTGQDVTITLPEMTYNVDHLLRTIRQRVSLPESPRRRRHWWGG